MSVTAAAASGCSQGLGALMHRCLVVEKLASPVGVRMALVGATGSHSRCQPVNRVVQARHCVTLLKYALP